MKNTNRDLSEEAINQLNDWSGLLSFIPTIPYNWVLHCESKCLCLYTGNQYGKTDTIAVDYVLRMLGKHPVRWKNILPTDEIRIFRFSSEVLPATGAEEAGSKNTQYPAFKKRLPPSLIKRDISDKNKTMTIRSLSGGPDIYVEFTAYAQGTGAQAGVQRKSVWMDESASRGIFDEQVPRLLAADGDLVYTMTPEPGLIGWEFDELYERAGKYLRTKEVRRRLFQRFGEKHAEIEIGNPANDITVIMAATDDNPIYVELAKKRSEQVGRIITPDEYIKEKLRLFDADEDVMDARRYGLFRHLSGRIFKTFTPSVHCYNHEKLFGAIA